MLELRRLEPPLLPALADGALDVSNFDSKYALCTIPPESQTKCGFKSVGGH